MFINCKNIKTIQNYLSNRPQEWIKFPISAITKAKSNSRVLITTYTITKDPVILISAAINRSWCDAQKKFNSFPSLLAIVRPEEALNPHHLAAHVT
jgi:hypothetical protein